MRFAGTPSDRLPGVLETGQTDIKIVYLALSERDPGGRDAEHIEWHTLDHRVEQSRLPDLRASVRLISTPACRAGRAASVGEFDATDHVMIYLFKDANRFPDFYRLGKVLDENGRWPIHLPRVARIQADLAGKAANPAKVVGADVVPWRPALGVYLLLEDGHAPPEGLVDIPGVIGVWWFRGDVFREEHGTDMRGRQITLCYLDRDPVEAATELGEAARRRWKGGKTNGLLAAPFHVVHPFDWARHLPA